MERDGSWSVDRIAAINLFRMLELEPTDDQMTIASERFAAHRRDTNSWAADRLHTKITDHLEAASVAYFQRQGDSWSDGYRTAQHELMRLLPDELIDTTPDIARTKGQILRSMIRRNRQSQ
ncbi:MULTISPECIES: hypothetical protein [unclassified Sphingomonas]|uniref:hypothetical protein n=1 Tax=unclassified Sphingomonas TaxID=196159 RepID=UPI000BDC784A|nr:MAG: hypothetical protein B7Z43_02170 [Sphingomonas sp. 12-62-6]OYX37892.1 MAG: hypothetical protein B7Y98_10790 [Sphingomonas sp. 32-62-10]